MNKNYKRGFIIGASLTSVVLLAIHLRGYCEPMYEKYPEYDRKIIRKAYNRMCLKSALGKYTDMDNWSEEKWHRMFLCEIASVR